MTHRDLELAVREQVRTDVSVSRHRLRDDKEYLFTKRHVYNNRLLHYQEHHTLLLRRLRARRRSQSEPTQNKKTKLLVDEVVTYTFVS